MATPILHNYFKDDGYTSPWKVTENTYDNQQYRTKHYTQSVAISDYDQAVFTSVRRHISAELEHRIIEDLWGPKGSELFDKVAKLEHALMMQGMQIQKLKEALNDSRS